MAWPHGVEIDDDCRICDVVELVIVPAWAILMGLRPPAKPAWNAREQLVRAAKVTRKIVEAARFVTPGPWPHDTSAKDKLRDALAEFDALTAGVEADHHG